MNPIYRQKYKRILQPRVWQSEGTFSVPSSIQNERQLCSFVFELCGAGLFMVLVWRKHRSRSPFYSTGTIEYKRSVPKFFKGLTFGARNEHDIKIYSNRMKTIFEPKAWKENPEYWQEKKETEEWKELV